MLYYAQSEKGTKGIDGRVISDKGTKGIQGKGQRAFVITLGRAGEDNKAFKLSDLDSTFAGFSSADYDLQVCDPRQADVSQTSCVAVELSSAGASCQPSCPSTFFKAGLLPGSHPQIVFHVPEEPLFLLRSGGPATLAFLGLTFLHCHQA
eukprot:1159673-Pelagomonas_calceolata.AAC.3